MMFPTKIFLYILKILIHLIKKIDQKILNSKKLPHKNHTSFFGAPWSSIGYWIKSFKTINVTEDSNSIYFIAINVKQTFDQI